MSYSHFYLVNILLSLVNLPSISYPRHLFPSLRGSLTVLMLLDITKVMGVYTLPVKTSVAKIAV